MTATASPIRNVSDTALWVAIYRAMESERGDALFRDPYARRLAGQRGEDIVRTIPGGLSGAWPMIVRTKLIDDVVMRCIDQGVGTVLNLAAGLDTRPYRLDLPRSLRWIHADMPAMVEHMKSAMQGEAPTCQLEYVALDLRDAQARRDLFMRAAEHGPVMVISEGLLVYLTAEQVTALARDLREVAGATRWLTDIATPRLRTVMQRQRKLDALERGNAPMQFFPENGPAFFEPVGWRESEFHSIWDASFRLKRTIRGGNFFRLLMKLQSAAEREAVHRMTGVVLMEAD